MCKNTDFLKKTARYWLLFPYAPVVHPFSNNNTFCLLWRIFEYTPIKEGQTATIKNKRGPTNRTMKNGGQTDETARYRSSTNRVLPHIHPFDAIYIQYMLFMSYFIEYKHIVDFSNYTTVDVAHIQYSVVLYVGFFFARIADLAKNAKCFFL